jgi:glycosyltransferase involved in cell wall biosynthesis
MIGGGARRTETVILRGGQQFAASEGAQFIGVPMSRSLLSARDLLAVPRCVNALRRLRPALVNYSTPKASLILALASAITRVPARVYVLRGLRLDGERHGSLRYRLLLLSEQLVASLSSVVVAPSAGIRDRARDLGIAEEPKLLLLGAGSTNGVDIDRFTPAGRPRRDSERDSLGIDRGEVVFGFVGRLVDDKGLAPLVAAFTELCREHDHLTLLIVGGADSSDPLSPSVSEVLADHPKIVTVGHYEDTTRAYAAMDVFVLPSKREGLSNVLLEAGACGLPTITSDTPGCRDAVAPLQSGLLVPVDDVAALARAMSEVASDEGRRHEMGKAGRDFVSRDFSQETLWLQLMHLYDDLLAR